LISLGHEATLVQMNYTADKTFDKDNFTQTHLLKGEYENCVFNQCDFSNSDLSEIKFIDCEFKSCDLSLAKINRTAFRDVKFKECKMLGLRFDTCHDFGLAFFFEGCVLNHSCFAATKIKKTTFRSSQLQETDFTDSDLTGAVFDRCDLNRTTFDNTVLEKTDFRTSFNYSIDPEINRIKKARFSLAGIPGLLAKYDIEIEDTE
jgi:fluoroquinolone resistance protein